MALSFSYSPRQSFVVPLEVCNEYAWDEACSRLATLRPGATLEQRSIRVHWVTKLQEAQHLLEILEELDEPVGFDFETRGWSPSVLRKSIAGGTASTDISPVHPQHRAIPVVFQLSWGQGAYVINADLLWVFVGWLTQTAKLDVANANFECLVCENIGFMLPRFHRDVIHMDFLLEETDRQWQHDLKSITPHYLGVKMISFQEVFSDVTFEQKLKTDPAIALQYAALDAYVTTLVADILEDDLQQREARPGYDSDELYMRWERPFQMSAVHMQTTGLPISEQVALKHNDAFVQKVEEIDAKAYEIVGHPISLSSTKQLSHFLYKERGLPITVTTGGVYCLVCDKNLSKKTGNSCPVHGKTTVVNKASTGKEVVEMLADQGDQFAKLIAERRRLEKDRGTWVEGYYRLRSEDGEGYPTLNTSDVVSGRFSGGIWLTTPLGLRDILGFEIDSGECLFSVDFCLPGDVEVVTEHGPMKMAEVVKSLPDVLSSRDGKSLCFKKVVAGGRVGFAHVHRITFTDGTTQESTADHKWMSYGGGGDMVETKSLKRGARLAHVKEPHAGLMEYPAWYRCRECYVTARFGGFCEVEKVEYSGIKPVYQLTVDDTHTYVLKNGLISGNSQLELRVMAHVSGDETLKAAFVQERDLHCQTGALLLLFKEKGAAALKDEQQFLEYYDLVTAAKKKDGSKQKLSDREAVFVKFRSLGKTINFGIVYGMGPGNIAKTYSMSLAEAQELFNVVWQAYSGLKGFFDANIARTTELGELRTLLGRNKKIHQLGSDRPAERAQGERLVMNTPCQAGAADCIRGAMIQLDIDIEAGGGYGNSGRGSHGNWVHRDGHWVWEPDWEVLPKMWESCGLPPNLQEGLGTLGMLQFRTALQIHDEIVFRGPKENGEAALTRARSIMRDPFGADLEFTVPLEVTGKVGQNLKELK